MKFVRRITVFFIIPMIMFAGGFASGMAVMDFFYPGRVVAGKNGAADVGGVTVPDAWPEDTGVIAEVKAGVADSGYPDGDGMFGSEDSESGAVAEADERADGRVAGSDGQVAGGRSGSGYQADGDVADTDDWVDRDAVSSDYEAVGGRISSGNQIDRSRTDSDNQAGRGVIGTEEQAARGAADSNGRAGDGITGYDYRSGAAGNEAEPAVREVSLNDGAAIHADTVYMVQEYHRDTGETAEETIPLPETFLGMSRELFVGTMADFSANPSLSERAKGFVGCEVVSFSPQRVVVRKTYGQKDAAEMPPGYYLVNEDNYITVYLGDRETVYMNTGILLQRLPEALQQEIIFIKFIAGDEELYSFLEAYSS